MSGERLKKPINRLLFGNAVFINHIVATARIFGSATRALSRDGAC